MQVFETAKKFHALGFAVHWLKPKSKAPVKSKWTTGPRATIKKLNQEYKPGFNIGVRLGEASKIGDSYLAVIDCDVKSKDPKHLKDLDKKLKELGINGTAPIVESGRGNGSKHIYIRTSKPIKPTTFAKSKVKVKVLMPSVSPNKKEKATLSSAELKKGIRLRAAWEISVMGQGQQVVLPPSTHPDTRKPYKWVTLPQKGEAIPLVDLALTGQEDKGEKPLTDFTPCETDLIDSNLSVDMVATIINGDGVDDRSAALLSASMSMLRSGFSEEQVLSVLTDKNYYLGQAAFEHAQTKSRKRAASWLKKYTTSKALKAINLDDEFSANVIESTLEPEAAKAQAKEIAEFSENDWTKKLERDQKGGRVKATFGNTKLILENIVGPGFVKHNEFTLEDSWLLPTPWGAKPGEQIRDIDIINIKAYLVEHFKVEVPKEKIIEVVQYIAGQNAYHPIRDYLEGLDWDGKPRIKTWLRDYLGVTAPDLYLETVSRKFLTAMVARVFEPGVAWHHVLILEGPTRHGKSETCKILAGKRYHFDNDLDLRNKDALQSLLGNWVIEIGELATMHKAGVNTLKNFISTDVDSFRKPYGRAVEHYKRQCVFVGTTNNEHYLKDLTGNQRYWPVRIDKLKYDELKRDRDQLFAEAVLEYQLGCEINYHSPEFYKLAEAQQNSKMEGQEFAYMVSKIIEGEESMFPSGEPFTSVDVLEHLKNTKGMGSRESIFIKISNALSSLGYEKRQKRIKGIKARWWSKNWEY